MESFVRQENVQHGVCNLAEDEFDIWRVRDSNWVTKYVAEKDYWCDTPTFCRTKKEVLKSLQTRLSILYKELELCQI